jgi:hypothetical protein
MLTYHASSERRGAEKMVRHALPAGAERDRLATPRHFMVVAHGPDWSIDGEYLVWNRSGGTRIFVLSPKTGGLPQQSSRLSYQRAPVMPLLACRNNHHGCRTSVRRSCHARPVLAVPRPRDDHLLTAPRTDPGVRC